MSVLREPAFWYGVTVGVLATVTSALVFTAYIHHRIKRAVEDDPPLDRDEPDQCPIQGSCPAYVPEADSPRCTEIRECQEPGPDPHAS